MNSSGRWHPAFEEYCETIYELTEDEIRLIQTRIAERLGVSRPAVSEMIHRLEAAGLISIIASVIELTDEGRSIAERVVRRHRLAERFLTDVLGVSWATAHREAGKWEHVISDEVEAAMARVLGYPTTCPHGNPIPGTAYLEPEMIRLAQLDPGLAFRIERITESLEFTDGMLEFLQASDVTPGRRGVVVASSPDGTCTVDFGGKLVELGAHVAQQILVST